jgi:hypothetical protein
MIQLAAQEAVDAELESRTHASQACKARLSSFFTSLGAPLSGSMTTPSNLAPALTATTITPEPAVTSPIADASPFADVSSPAGGVGYGRDRHDTHDKVDTHSFAHQLDYPDDDEDNDHLLFIASPTQVELDAPYDPDKHLLTPGQGSPKMDPAYTNRLQNPDSYGPTLTLKTLAMISNTVFRVVTAKLT